jgi:hypothetical protein
MFGQNMNLPKVLPNMNLYLILNQILGFAMVLPNLSLAYV